MLLNPVRVSQAGQEVGKDPRSPIAVRPKDETWDGSDIKLQIDVGAVHDGEDGAMYMDNGVEEDAFAWPDELAEDDSVFWPDDVAEDESVGAEFRRHQEEHNREVREGERDDIIAEEAKADKEEARGDVPAPPGDAPRRPRRQQQRCRRFAVHHRRRVLRQPAEATGPR